MSRYPNSGTLNKNDRKEKDTHADYRGQCEINGVGFWIDAWLKPSKDGGKFMSLSFKPKEPAQQQSPMEQQFRKTVNDTFGNTPQRSTGAKSHIDANDEIPW